MSKKLYGHYDDLMDYDTYPAHVMAMTAEGLHSKSEIAAELAYRDQRIAELESELAELRQRKEEILMALLIGGRECAEIEFGADHEHIKRLAHGTWAGWLEKARLELLQEPPQ